MAKSDVTIYHNPRCQTSRNVLAHLRDAGVEPHIVEYLKTPPSRSELQRLIKRMGARPRDVLRRRARSTLAAASESIRMVTSGCSPPQTTRCRSSTAWLPSPAISVRSPVRRENMAMNAPATARIVTHSSIEPSWFPHVPATL